MNQHEVNHMEESVILTELRWVSLTGTEKHLPSSYWYTELVFFNTHSDSILCDILGDLGYLNILQKITLTDCIDDGMPTGPG